MIADRTKSAVRRVLKSAGWRLSRTPANRFDAMQESLELLRSRGYSPLVIIDAGANMGKWTRMTRCVFPAAEFHMIEPQPACFPTLRSQASEFPRTHVHEFAVTADGIERVQMVGGGDGGTGAWVATSEEERQDLIDCPATTLDRQFGDRISPRDRALLKLDLEGHEIDALTGASRVLRSVEVVLMELQFFRINNNNRPVFRDMVNFMANAGFELYDFGALSSRTRDRRLRQGDALFVRADSNLLADTSWV